MIASLIAGGAGPYAGTFDDDAWPAGKRLDPGPCTEAIARFLATGKLS
ncbi:hypothetical protein J2S43_003951 [Catenuloplanes nepalensis]|uniref:Uncharacterized protein n=1 Tax=Catenuloplanes nepalensis TaxID=587533 RepID=A0ABT9MVM9_9ACTN|nr:hypothetical protein [Catenuloplanes nepalensis]MDP9795439.1 hypothetical protein [Catenuloplanes nepalensis]